MNKKKAYKSDNKYTTQIDFFPKYMSAMRENHVRPDAQKIVVN